MDKVSSPINDRRVVRGWTFVAIEVVKLDIGANNGQFVYVVWDMDRRRERRRPRGYRENEIENETNVDDGAEDYHNC